MARTGRIVLLAALCALLLVPLAEGRTGGGNPAAHDPYWFGPSFAGLLVHDPESANDSAFTYGDCELPEGEGGCAPPVQIQNQTSCARNPIGLDRLPTEVHRLRSGGLVAAYEATAVDVGTGNRTVTIYTSEPELIGAAEREFHRKSQSAPQPLAPPVYPPAVLRELVRVTSVAKRIESVEGIARATGLSPAEVRLRLRIAELLPPDALAGVRPPTMSVATVERLRQLAFNAQYDFARTARKHGLTRAELEQKVRLVRGLTGNC